MTGYIISLIVTIILGTWAIRLARKQLYPGRITFVQEGCIALFDSIVRNLPELAVNYKRRPIRKNLFLLKGSFVNTGTKDISRAMVEQKLTINLPEKYKWLTAKVVSASDNLKAKAEISNKSSLIFDIRGLFRRKEFIRFEALVEVPTGDQNGRKGTKNSQNKISIKPEEKLTKALEFNHRIADTRKVNRTDLSKIDAELPIAFAFMVFLFLVGFFYTLKFEGLPTKTTFIMQTEDNKAIEVSVRIKADGNYEVKGVDEDYKKILPSSEFLDKKLSPKVIVDPNLKKTAIGIGLFFLLFFSGAIGTFLNYRRKKRLKNIISSSI